MRHLLRENTPLLYHIFKKKIIKFCMQNNLLITKTLFFFMTSKFIDRYNINSLKKSFSHEFDVLTKEASNKFYESEMLCSFFFWKVKYELLLKRIFICFVFLDEVYYCFQLVFYFLNNSKIFTQMRVSRFFTSRKF